MTTPRREVFWIPLSATPIQNSAGQLPKADLIEMPERPTRVWTITQGKDWRNPAVKPEPFFPHLPIAFPEDAGHDYRWEAGTFLYRSRVCEGNVWILAEYGDCSQLFEGPEFKFCPKCGQAFEAGHKC